jgi:protein O-mannosyl-transferase
VTSVQQDGATRRPEDKETSLSLTPWEQLLRIGLFMGILLVYLPAARHEFIYDDRSMILHQPVPGSATEFLRTVHNMSAGLPYYRPVSWGSLLLQKWLHGDVPALFHLANVALLGTIACLFFLLLRLPTMAVRPVPALLAAAMFAVHPAASSAVYPAASGRETLLPSLLVMVAMYGFLRGGRWWYAASLAAYTLALFSKELAVITPSLFVLADLLKLSPDSPGHSLSSWIRRYSTVAVLTAGYFVLRWSLFHGTEFTTAMNEHPAGPFLSLAYAWQSAWVPTLELLYEPPVESWLSLPRLCMAIVAGLLLGTAVWKHRKACGSRGLFWAGWFLLALLPTANLLRQEVPFDERYLFLALPALVALAAVVVSTAWERVAVRQATMLAGTVLLCVCAAVTCFRGTFFQTEIEFYRQWTRGNPHLAVPWHNLGNAYLARGNIRLAISNLETAARVDPGFSQSHFDLGLLQMRQGENEQALNHFRRVMELQPDHADARINSGNLLLQQGLADEALAMFTSAARLQPDSALAQEGLGSALHVQRRYQDAVPHLEEALRLSPDTAIIHFRLADCLHQTGDSTRAIEHLHAARKLVPEDSPAAAEIQQKLNSIDSTSGSKGRSRQSNG